MFWKRLIAFATVLSTVEATVEALEYVYEGGAYDFPDYQMRAYNGIPLTISCGPDESLDRELDDNEIVQCVIMKDDEVIYNETINWIDRFKHGVGDIPDESWDGARVTVHLIWDVDSTTETYPITLTENSGVPDCHNPSDDSETMIEIGERTKISCSDSTMMAMSEEQFSSITVEWYKDCKKIIPDNQTFEIVSQDFDKDEFVFSKLDILNASFAYTPGVYHCTISVNGDSDDKKEKKLVLSTHKICVKHRYSYSNQPVIRTSQTHYDAQPGTDIIVTANGQSGMPDNSPSRSITWKKINPKTGDKIKICSTMASEEQENCSASYYKNPKYCTEVSNISTSVLDDNFTATLTLRNVAEKDSGQYVVKFVTSRGPVNASFTLKVAHPPTEHKKLTIAVVVAAVFILIGVIALLLLYKYRTDVKYLLKKIFKRRAIIGARPMAYLVYAPDVFQNENSNPYEAVRQFLGDRRYYDPADPMGLLDNAAGQLAANHVANILQQCMTMIVFVTDHMLDKRNNGMEEFEVYKGFNANLQDELPIIFICTRDVLRRVKRENINNNATFREFMRRQRNTVIIWSENHPNRFRRALYVALPNVIHPNVCDEDAKV